VLVPPQSLVREPPDDAEPPDDVVAPGKRPVLIRASDIRTEYQTQLLEGLIPAATLTVLAGVGGVGKSVWLLKQMALGSLGRLNGDYFGQTIISLAVSLEDDWSRVTVPRLRAAGADLDQIYRLAMAEICEGVPQLDDPIFPVDELRLEEAIRQVGARLVMLDPAQSLMQGNLDKRDDARRALNSLARVAQNTGAAIVLVAHFGKGGGPVSEKISGSHAFRDAVRSVLVVALDQDSGNRILTVDKCNYGPYQGQSYSFTVNPVKVCLDDGQTGTYPVVSGLQASSVSVADLLAKDDDADSPGEINAWLQDYLGSVNVGGESTAADIFKAGKLEGYSVDQLKRAKKRLGIESVKMTGKAGCWLWRLPLDSEFVREQGSKGSKSAAYTDAALLASRTPLDPDKPKESDPIHVCSLAPFAPLLPYDGEPNTNMGPIIDAPTLPLIE